MFKGDLEGVLKEYLEGDLDVDLEGDFRGDFKLVLLLEPGQTKGRYNLHGNRACSS